MVGMAFLGGSWGHLEKPPATIVMLLYRWEFYVRASTSPWETISIARKAEPSFMFKTQTFSGPFLSRACLLCCQAPKSRKTSPEHLALLTAHRKRKCLKRPNRPITPGIGTTSALVRSRFPIAIFIPSGDDSPSPCSDRPRSAGYPGVVAICALIPGKASLWRGGYDGNTDVPPSDLLTLTFCWAALIQHGEDHGAGLVIED
jgi:hypothetical protein